MLFSQPVGGDGTSFHPDILALTRHARRRGRTVKVRSSYLPEALLQAAKPYWTAYRRTVHRFPPVGERWANGIRPYNVSSWGANVTQALT
ncbi:hypothetical protein [Streptomyces hirsutus]|uniref:hypothetical protein n=1 Tax=Streptomyces hirsutus TaxID=35620 RepID=UPI00332ACA4C